MNDYFILNHNCFCELGSEGAAIYDTNRENLFGVDLAIGEIIRECEGGTPFERILMDFPEEKKAQIRNYFAELVQNDLGSFHDRFVMVEQLKPAWTIDKIESYMNAFQLHTLWIEVAGQCNLDCVHCREHDGGASRCSCSRDTDDSKGESPISLQAVKKAIHHARIFGGKEIRIIGGEPLLKPRRLAALIKYARLLDFGRIAVHSNLLALTPKMIETIKRSEATPVTHFYSHDRAVHDRITRVPGSWERWLKNCRLLIEHQAPPEVEIEVMKANQEGVKQTVEFLKDLGLEEIRMSFVRSTDPALFPDRFAGEIYKSENTMAGVSKSQYFFQKERNSCWFGKLAVTAAGEILPCIRARSQPLGKITETSIQEILQKKTVKKWWTLTRDKLDACRECEFRYACVDCRPVECSGGELTGANRFCRIREEAPAG